MYFRTHKNNYVSNKMWCLNCKFLCKIKIPAWVTQLWIRWNVLTFLTFICNKIFASILHYNVLLLWQNVCIHLRPLKCKLFATILQFFFSPVFPSFSRNLDQQKRKIQLSGIPWMTKRKLETIMKTKPTKQTN